MTFDQSFKTLYRPRAKSRQLSWLGVAFLQVPPPPHATRRNTGPQRMYGGLAILLLLLIAVRSIFFSKLRLSCRPTPPHIWRDVRFSFAPTANLQVRSNLQKFEFMKC